MAHIKGGGVVKGSRKAQAKRRGVKVFGGQQVKIGNIIVRQKGTRFHSGQGTAMGRDYTIFAMREGTVEFKQKFGDKFIVVKDDKH